MKTPLAFLALFLFVCGASAQKKTVYGVNMKEIVCSLEEYAQFAENGDLSALKDKSRPCATISVRGDSEASMAGTQKMKALPKDEGSPELREEDLGEVGVTLSAGVYENEGDDGVFFRVELKYTLNELAGFMEFKKGRMVPAFKTESVDTTVYTYPFVPVVVGTFARSGKDGPKVVIYTVEVSDRPH